MEGSKFERLSQAGPPADRAFHEARWSREAESKNEEAIHGILMKMGVKDAATPEDVMYAEALKDNEHFDKRLSHEYRRWDEKLQEMVRDFRAVRDGTPDKPEHFKAVRLMLGTGLGSGYGTGQDMALEDMGYNDIFDVVIGSSGASGPAAYSVAGESRKAASLYMNECASPEFLTHFPLKLDTRVIAEEMRSGPKALNQDAIRESKKELYAIVSNANTRKAEFVDFKTATPDMVSACEASSAIPFFRDSVEVDGTHYYDGAFSELPLEEIIERFKPTHLFIQPNVAFKYLQSYEYSGVERAVLWATAKLGALASLGTVEEFFRMKENTRKLFEKVGKMHNVKIAVMWPPAEDLGSLVNDPDTMRRAILESYRKTVSDFGEIQPQKIELYPGDIPEIEDDEPETLKMAA